jgi:hypothetical protein
MKYIKSLVAVVVLGVVSFASLAASNNASQSSVYHSKMQAKAAHSLQYSNKAILQDNAN